MMTTMAVMKGDLHDKHINIIDQEQQHRHQQHNPITMISINITTVMTVMVWLNDHKDVHSGS